MATGQSEITLRFLAAPTDVATLGGSIHGGRVLEWIDKAAYALAVGWSGHYCVTAYVGEHPVRPADRVRATWSRCTARLMHTGAVEHGHARHGVLRRPAGRRLHRGHQLRGDLRGGGREREVDGRAALDAGHRLDQRVAGRRASSGSPSASNIENAMAEQTYTDAGHRAPAMTLRFLAAPTDVNWGGKAHGGTVMRWIDEAAFAGRRRLVRGPVHRRVLRRGAVLPADPDRARGGGGGPAAADGRTSMHIAVHVRSGRPDHRGDAPDHALPDDLRRTRRRREAPGRCRGGGPGTPRIGRWTPTRCT